MLAAQKWPSKDIPMRMSSGSILQVKNYDEHHFVYFDKVDDWYKPAQFPFVIDWKINDNGKFVTFSRQEIEQERAVGVQRLTNPAHRSIMSINMFDSATLTLSYYIGNSCIPFTSTNGKRLDKLIEQRHLPNDASFIAVPGYHRVNFPFVVMDVSSKGEIYIVNTKTWFRQMIIKMVKDHNEDLVAQFFFSYEPKSMPVSFIFGAFFLLFEECLAG